MQEGYIVKSLKGHDTDRVYVVASKVNEDFVLVVDGKYRKLDNPKLKRIKHLEVIRESELPAGLTDKAVEKSLNRFREGVMPKDDNIEAEGTVVECLRNAMFKVKLSNGHIVTCTISGKIRMHYIKILEGDTVKIEMSPYDITKGRITYRNKN